VFTDNVESNCHFPLLAGTVRLSVERFKVFPIQVKYRYIKTTKPVYRSSSREPGNDSYVQLYQWTHCSEMNEILFPYSILKSNVYSSLALYIDYATGYNNMTIRTSNRMPSANVTPQVQTVAEKKERAVYTVSHWHNLIRRTTRQHELFNNSICISSQKKNTFQELAVFPVGQVGHRIIGDWPLTRSLAASTVDKWSRAITGCTPIPWFTKVIRS
jgi:hypothetical protein